LCPVCKNLLGPNPWEHGKLKFDFMLDSLVRKVGPATAIRSQALAAVSLL
jgi:hypothetical protein